MSMAVGVKGIGILEVVVPDLVHDIAEKFGNAPLGRFVTGVVIKAGFMGRLCTNSEDCRGVVGNVFSLGTWLHGAELLDR